MLPSAPDLAYFLEVADTTNISRAAERLGITQPSLSMAIQRLERTIGVPLLIRSKSGVSLSRAGQKLVPKARALLEEWERVRIEAVRDESEVGGRYILGCHPSVAQYSLPAVLPQLLAAHPTLEVRLVHDLSRRITEDVISFKVDFGIVVNPVQHPDLVIKKICDDDVQLWTGREATPLQDPASGHGVLIMDPDLIQTQELVRKFSRKKWHFSRTILSGSLEVVATLVDAGAGAGILPGRVAGRFGLQPCGGRDAPKFADEICFVYRADAQKTRAGRAVAQFVEGALRKGLA